MDMLSTANHPVVTVYRAFRELASRIERMTRSYEAGFYWLRKDTLKSAETICAILRDVAQTTGDREALMLLYQCRHEVRETLRHLHYAVDAKLLDASEDRLEAPYREASRALEDLIAAREECTPSLWEMPLSVREAPPAELYGSQTRSVGL